MPVKTVTSPSSEPQVTFCQATRGGRGQMKMGYVKQDTWHVSKQIFCYMHLYTFLRDALLSKYYFNFYEFLKLSRACDIV